MIVIPSCLKYAREIFSNVLFGFFKQLRFAGSPILSLMFVSFAAQGVDWEVKSSDDLPDSIAGDGTCKASNDLCTLRAAIEEANSINEPHTIILEGMSYTLSHKQNQRVLPLVIQADCTVGQVTCGIGSNKITIQGRGPDVTTIQLKDGEEGRLVYVAQNNMVELSGIKLANGKLKVARNDNSYPGSGGGGAIKIQAGAHAVIKNVSLENNEVQRDHGGAIYNSGTLYLSDSKMLGNRYESAGPPGYGGALYHRGDYAGLTDTLIENNEAVLGGGIYVAYTNVSGQSERAAPRMDINRSMIRGNTAIRAGGGLYDAGSETELSDISIVNNTVESRADSLGGGGIYKTGTGVVYHAHASTTDRELRGAAIFRDTRSVQYACRACHIDFARMPNNGKYTDVGLVNKILYTMPPAHPNTCDIQCAVDVMFHLSQAEGYDLRQTDNASDLRGSDWYGSRSLKLEEVLFEGNSFRGRADHCKIAVPVNAVANVSEENVRVVPEGGPTCRSTAPRRPTNIED